MLFWVRDEGEGPITVKDRRLGTDRRRSRQRTAVVSDVSYATVCLVRHALAGIERATCSTDRLAVWTASCGSLVESVLRPGGWENLCRLMCHCVRHVSLDNKYGRSVKRYTRHDHVERLARSSVPAHRKSRRQEELDGERESPKVLTEVSEVRLDAVSSPQV